MVWEWAKHEMGWATQRRERCKDTQCITCFSWEIQCDLWSDICLCWWHLIDNSCHSVIDSMTLLWQCHLTDTWLTVTWRSSVDTVPGGCYLPQLGTDSWLHVTTISNLQARTHTGTHIYTRNTTAFTHLFHLFLLASSKPSRLCVCVTVCVIIMFIAER